MNKLAALIDFTPTCEVTLAYTIRLAKTLKAEVVLVNIEDDPAEKTNTEQKLEDYARRVRENQLACTAHVEIGDFNTIIDSALQFLNPKMVLTGTHGIKGLKQTLFGAHILKLAQEISLPMLVVQDNSKMRAEGIRKILFSMGPHEHFEPAIELVAAFAQELGSKIVIYTIVKSPQDISEELTHNNNYAKKVFENLGIAFEHVVEESQDFSLGYSRQTIHFMENQAFDMVVMPADASEQFRAFSQTDKENLLLNTLAVPVLCV